MPFHNIQRLFPLLPAGSSYGQDFQEQNCGYLYYLAEVYPLEDFWEALQATLLSLRSTILLKHLLCIGCSYPIYERIMVLVSSSSPANFRNSSKPRSAWLPTLITAESPLSSCRLQSTTVVIVAPLCEMNARCPGFGDTGSNVNGKKGHGA